MMSRKTRHLESAVCHPLPNLTFPKLQHLSFFTGPHLNFHYSFFLPVFNLKFIHPFHSSSSSAMDDYNRSKSYGPNAMQLDTYYPPPPPASQSRPPTSFDLRSYSASYAHAQMSTYEFNSNNYNVKDFKLKKGKTISASSSSSAPWSLADPEFQRKKRVASYKMYSVEGKVKGSLSKSFRWLKDRYTQVLYGWW